MSEETDKLVEQLLETLRANLTEAGVQQWLRANINNLNSWLDSLDTYL